MISFARALLLSVLLASVSPTSGEIAEMLFDRFVGNPYVGPCASRKHGGFRVPKENFWFRIGANGCGPDGATIKEPYGLHKCCNMEDICYSMCGLAYTVCRDAFSTCTDTLCQNLPSKKRKRCQEYAAKFVELSRTKGEENMDRSQTYSCDCEPDAEQYKHSVINTLKAFYNDPTLSGNSTSEFRGREDEMAVAWRGRLPRLLFEIAKKYHKEAVEFEDVPEEIAE